MRVFLWAVGDRYTGVSGDEAAAKQAASERLKRGDAARVERAVFTLGPGPVGSYILVGTVWKTVRPWRGPITWTEFPSAQDALAS